ncbi:MAG: hypothetical protein ACR2ML_08105 [Solirubrobacteraceae bacterium]
MPEISVVHLVWAPLGTAHLERFARSYRQHAAGIDHRLVIAFNGFEEEQPLDSVRAVVADLPHEAIRLPRPRLDLAAHREVAAGQPTATHICFLNSYSELLADGWLRSLIDHLEAPGVGMVGATGSMESAYTAWLPVVRLLRRPRYPPFPNPHLRTNAFAIRRDTMLDLRWPAVRTKGGALALESGRRSVTRQLWARGLQTLVVGRDRAAYDVDRWHASATFRCGAQDNLLVADNRTQQFSSADPALRRRLAELAWGPQAAELVEAASRPAAR